MKKNLLLYCVLGLIVLSSSLLRAQTPEPAASMNYDPLIPQLFAFDKEHQIFAGISAVNNAIDIIKYTDNKLSIQKSILVDVFQKRHDEHAIYRPLSVAIYDGHIVYLASHRDSCFLSVLNIEGSEINRFYFAGRATAFSYSPEAGELYIAGQNDLGYDIAVLDVKDGFDKLSMDNGDLSIHYRLPKKAEQILEKDPLGIGLAVIAMSVVFLALLVLFLSFKGVGNAILALQRKKTAKLERKEAEAKGEAIPSPTSSHEEISGEIFAALSTAIFMYNNELHDEENTVLTIEKVSRSYSPWSSKLYGLNTYFNHRR